MNAARHFPLATLWLSCLLLLASALPVRAESDAAAEADALFARGRERLAAGDYAQACLLLAESFRRDAATGSLLALALCHERAGKLASACAAYAAVAARAHEEGRADRERAAQEKLTQLKDQLSSLSLDVSALQHEPSLHVRVNGQALTSEELAQPWPVDGGEFVVEVVAEGKQPWRVSVSVADSGENVALTVPELAPLASATKSAPRPAANKRPVSVAVPALRPRGPLRRDVEAGSGRSAGEWTGIALLTAGGATLVTSVGLVLRAAHLDNRRRYECPAGMCSGRGDAARTEARRAREASLLVALAGMGVCTAGLISFIWGRHTQPSRLAARTHASAWVSPSGVGGGVLGTF